MRVLVVNAGSSSLKLRLLDAGDTLAARADLPARGGRFDPDAVAAALDEVGAGSADAVGHRVVHGGSEFTGPVVIDPGVRKKLDKLADLAPLHMPKSLAGIDAVNGARLGLPAVACFDTAFHASLPPAAATYAIPGEWRERYGLRRYGFHGLSHAYASRRAAELVGGAGPAGVGGSASLAGSGDPAGPDGPGDPGGLRAVVCHLGAGASLAAVRDGHCADTTMGFTPLEGLVMATRSGTVDPGLLLWLNQHARVPVDEISDALEHRSGLAALAGNPDMQAVLTAVHRGDGAARLAIDVYVHRLRAEIAAMAAALGGLDVLVFTGGVGEHAAEVRERAVSGLGFLGAAIDSGRNAGARGDADVTADGAAVRVLVIAAREDLEIARQVRTVLPAG